MASPTIDLVQEFSDAAFNDFALYFGIEFTGLTGDSGDPYFDSYVETLSLSSNSNPGEVAPGVTPRGPGPGLF